MLGIDPADADKTELKRGIPSDVNFNTGYSGRTGVFEVLGVDDEIRSAVLKGHSHLELMNLAESKGMITLEQSAIRKVKEGVTSIEEMHRILTTF